MSDTPVTPEQPDTVVAAAAPAVEAAAPAQEIVSTEAPAAQEVNASPEPAAEVAVTAAPEPAPELALRTDGTLVLHGTVSVTSPEAVDTTSGDTASAVAEAAPAETEQEVAPADTAESAVVEPVSPVTATAPTTESTTTTNADGSQTTTTTTTVTRTPQEIIAAMERKAAVTQATATLQASMNQFMFQYGYTKLMTDPSGGMMSDYVPLAPITANVGRVLGIVTMVGDQFDDDDVALLISIQKIPGPMEYRPGTVRERVLIKYGIDASHAIITWHNKYPKTNQALPF